MNPSTEVRILAKFDMCQPVFQILASLFSFLFFLNSNRQIQPALRSLQTWRMADLEDGWYYYLLHGKLLPYLPRIYLACSVKDGFYLIVKATSRDLLCKKKKLYVLQNFNWGIHRMTFLGHGKGSKFWHQVDVWSVSGAYFSIQVMLVL